MSKLSFNTVAAVIFGIVSLGHAARLALALSVQIGDMAVPFWMSWVGLLVTGALCIWGFRSRAR